ANRELRNSRTATKKSCANRSRNSRPPEPEAMATKTDVLRPGEFCHKRVGNLEIRIDVLNVVVVFERTDKAEDYFASFIVDADRILRFPDQACLARRAEFHFQRLRHLAQTF